MLPGLCGAWLVLVTVFTASVPASVAASETRYRGDYIAGHEVRTFCPANASRCYWLAPGTPAAVREALSSLAAPSAEPHYPETCVVVAAEGDTESPREGFAADYDGLIDIRKVYGRCDEITLVAQGDIAHHRWVASLPEPFNSPLTPSLDFGQRIGNGVFVSGNDGCSTFTAVVLLRDAAEFSELELGPSNCGTIDEQPEFDLREAGSLTLHPDDRLQLQTSSALVRFELKDWMK